MKKLMILGLSVLLMTSCSSENVTQENQTPATTQESATETAFASTESPAVETAVQGGGLQQETFITLEEAVAIFNSTFQNAGIEEIELEYEGGSIHYDIKGFDETKEYELVLDAKTGDILKQEEDNESDIVESLVYDNIIGFKEAMEKALVENPNGQVESVKLDMDMGKPVYEVDFEGDQDVIVPAIAE